MPQSYPWFFGEADFGGELVGGYQIALAARTTQVQSATSPGIVTKSASQANVPHPVVPPPLSVPTPSMQPRPELKLIERAYLAVKLPAALAAVQLMVTIWGVAIFAELQVSRLL